jgi:hypothetical protein
MIGRAFAIVLMVLFLAPMQGFAVQPDEILDDPVLETRARAISADLRCLVCQNQSIDDSDAELAREVLEQEQLLGRRVRRRDHAELVEVAAALRSAGLPADLALGAERVLERWSDDKDRWDIALSDVFEHLSIRGAEDDA